MSEIFDEQRTADLRPWRRRKALKGERQAPRSRKTSTRTLTAKARLPNVSALRQAFVSGRSREAAVATRTTSARGNPHSAR